MKYTKVSHLTDEFRGLGFTAVSVPETDTRTSPDFFYRNKTDLASELISYYTYRQSETVLAIGLIPNGTIWKFDG